MIHRLNPASPWVTGTLEIIQQFIQQPVLFLEQDDVSVDQATWSVNLTRIDDKIKSLNINCIVIDATMNPEIFTADCYQQVPKQKIIEDLNKICSSYYVTSDYEYFYKPSQCIKFFPAFLWTISSQQVDQYFPEASYRRYATSYDAEITKTHALMCLNRNMSWHRLYLFSLLVEQTWFDKITYSFLNSIGNRCDAFVIKQNLTSQEIEKILKIGRAHV